MKNVRAIFVNQKTGLIQAVIRVAANVISAIAQQDGFARTAGQPLRQHAAGEPCANNEVIVGEIHAAEISTVDRRLIASST